jgi:hypothetical protein
VPINSPRYGWSELDGDQRAELNQQIVDVTEAFLDGITHLQAWQSFAETRLVEYLPRQFLPYYNPAFARRSLVAFLTVAWKLTDPEDHLAAFEEAVYEDHDFLLLFDPSKDGIAEAVAPALPDLTAFHVKDWFEPFNEHDRAVHPYQLLAPRPVTGRSGPGAGD